MGAFVAKFLGRILTYLLGLLVVLALVGTGAFVIARPQIDEFVSAEIKKRGLEIEGWELGFNGRANLRQARMTLPEGIELKAALISARPPLAGFPGAATLYDLRLERGDISLTIPELDISSISQYEKEPAIANKLLQALQQFAFDQVTASAIRLTVAGGDGATLTLKDFILSNMEQGKIGRLMLAGMEGHVKDTNQPTTGGQGRIGVLEIKEIDIEAALSYLTGQLGKNEENKAQIIGEVKLSDLNFEGQIATKTITLKLDDFSSGAISLTPSDLVPLDSIRSFMVARRESASLQEQSYAQERLLALLGNLNGFDVTLKGLELGVPTAKVEWQSLSLQASSLAALMPENLDMTMEGLILDITNPPEGLKPALTATGYDRIEASAALHARWDKENQRLTLKDLSFIAKNVGDFFLKFQIDHVDGLPFGASNQAREEWLQKLRLHDFDMGVRDRGALDNFAIIVADIGEVEPEEIREGLEIVARGAPPILFEDEEALVQNAEQALLAFFNQSGLLRLHVSSRGEAGIGFDSIMADVVDWPSLLALAEIRFTHEATADSSN